MYQIIFRNPAKKLIKKLDKNIQKQIINKIKKLSENPYLGKRLSGNLYGLWKLRFDKFRIIYKFKNKELVIYIMNLEHRKNIY